MHILYYISAHGYGHGVRSCAICNRFSPDIKLTFRTVLPESFLREELSRTFDYYPGKFDCGCIQSDSLTVDIEKTLLTYMEISDNNKILIGNEIRWCSENNVSAILTDIVPFACEVGKKAGIPSIVITNFTWFDIYEPYLKTMPSFKPYLEQIAEQYEMADLLVALAPANPMDYFKKRTNAPAVGKRGVDIRDRINNIYGIDRAKNLGLIYTGEAGFLSGSWKRLEIFDEWDFIGIYPLPGNPANYHNIKKKGFGYQDISASVDCIISKIGYGIFTECVGNGVPLIYTPRFYFAEHPFLEKSIIDWGHGYSLNRDDFYCLNWKNALQMIEEKQKPEKIELHGAEISAEKIEKFLR